VGDPGWSEKESRYDLRGHEIFRALVYSFESLG
jgi:hypothetical protein